MPLFVTYVGRVGAGGRAPLLELEADGRLLPADRPGKAKYVSISELAIESELWYPLNHTMASSGRVEFVPDDDSDNCLFWLVTGSIVQIRAFGTILQLDLTHIDRPDQPATPDLGGEG